MATGVDPFDLERFVRAQDADGTYERAIRELRAGRKTTHWMWFVFPQMAGLGVSATSRAFAVSSIDEAAAYLRHPVLGARLVECARTVAELLDTSAVDVFGVVDAAKLHSSVTLFRLAAPDREVFSEVLDRYFAGEDDPATVRLL